MVGRANRGKRVLRRSLLLLCLGLNSGGCGQQEQPAQNADQPPWTPPPARIAPPAAPAQAAPNGQGAAPAASPLHVPFKDATLAEPPEEQLLPPETTKAGKSVGKLYEMVSKPGGLWDQVLFATPAGKRLHHTATIKTDLGVIQIELRPDVAPAHVRNFVALARAGYYDGLEVDRTVREELQGAKDNYFEYLEAGCPLGTGEPGYGSIGYWMKPELSDKVKHGEGIVGAWHGEDLETAGCKFYITLSAAPWMDGNWTVFGKVTQGLDVARTILTRPTRDDELKDRPVEPVVIRSITIETREAD
ncbi:MAG: peptidylprolyl isomerase [Gemmataceae bacterium]|nr:peptidylprolyl isomerase [Gemmataceae bacterium]